MSVAVASAAKPAKPTAAADAARLREEMEEARAAYLAALEWEEKVAAGAADDQLDVRGVAEELAEVQRELEGLRRELGRGPGLAPEAYAAVKQRVRAAEAAEAAAAGKLAERDKVQVYAKREAAEKLARFEAAQRDAAKAELRVLTQLQDAQKARCEAEEKRLWAMNDVRTHVRQRLDAIGENRAKPDEIDQLILQTEQAAR